MLSRVGIEVSDRVFYRDPQSPDRLHGPVTANDLKELAAQGQIQPSFEYSFDRQIWRGVQEIEPPLFVFGQNVVRDAGHPKDGLARPTVAADSTVQTVAESPGDRASDDAIGTTDSTPRPSTGQTDALLDDSTVSLVTRGAQWVRTAALRFFRLLKAAVVFYWQQRRRLYRFVQDYVRLLLMPRDQREIRLAADDSLSSILFDDSRWEVELPDCCVVCGASTSRDWEEKSETTVDLMTPTLALAGGVVAGLVLSLFFWKLWILPICILAGMLLGFAERRTIDVHLRLKRCDRHVNHHRIPKSVVSGDHLVLTVGHRSVKLQFYSAVESSSPSADPLGRTGSSGGDSQTSSPHAGRTTIPLAGSDGDESVSANAQSDSAQRESDPPASDETGKSAEPKDAEPEIVDFDEWIDIDR